MVVLEHKTEEIKKEIKKEQARMNILKAELCYISRPQRIRHLTEKHLKSLGQTKAEQIVKNVKDNPKKYQTPIRKVVSKKVENIKWNFKT
ncbi:hypothetical protein FZC37_02045 [Candidatus Sneabacter namystus]|uniref:Uncharacterized protein n=1 Tax=Candidatus Sneabacter namystus TaxID=2601646 RepID=A0A5C0UJK8_9RICK|nr:hypothetical protein FZC37_02045 [Candidatus Sneabacter namystus]